ncbi:MAG: M48 family metallopeptidase [Chloroflexi bacterium]|nr:M48 family metallopeptidase [Chloroflexota bacterium]
MTERDSVRIGATVIEYEIRRSERRRKTVQIRIDGGAVRVAAPSATPDGELRAIVRKRASWILKRLAEAAPEAAEKRFVSGETLPYLGEQVSLVVDCGEAPSPQVRLDRGRLRIVAPEDLEDGAREERIRGAVVAWYRARAAERYPAAVDRWWPRLGCGEPSRVLIRDQRRRWGSCASDGTLRFSWRGMMLEPALIDYIVVHELAHLAEQNHSPDFWELVTNALPDARERRTRLREAGRTLPL